MNQQIHMVFVAIAFPLVGCARGPQPAALNEVDGGKPNAGAKVVAILTNEERNRGTKSPDLRLSHRESVERRVPGHSDGEMSHASFFHQGEPVTFIHANEYETLFMFIGEGEDFREIRPDSASAEEKEFFEKTLRGAKDFDALGREQFENIDPE